MSATDVELICKESDDALRSVDAGDVSECEGLIERLSVKLAPTHYILLTAKKYLADLLGVVKGYTYGELSAENLQKKIDYLTEYADVLGRVDQGYPTVSKKNHLNSDHLLRIFSILVVEGKCPVRSPARNPVSIKLQI